MRLVALILSLFLALPASAQTMLPTLFDVTGVAGNDRLNVRAMPDASASILSELAPDAKLFFHSCGNVRPLLPDFIEMGVDILNPVHISATGMEPVALKREFGKDIVFWGGAVDTQDVLPYGTPGQVRDDARRNIEALAPGGGYVFNTVHNIQADVPAENIVALWETLREFGRYR